MTIKTLFWSFFKLCSSSWIPWHVNWASTRCKIVLIFFPFLSMHRFKQQRTNFIKLLFIYLDNRPFISCFFPGLKIYKPYLKSSLLFSRHGVHDELLKWRNVQKRVLIVTYVQIFCWNKHFKHYDIKKSRQISLGLRESIQANFRIWNSFLFVCLEFFVPLEYFFIWKSWHCRWRAANFDLCSALMAIERATLTVTRGICL